VAEGETQYNIPVSSKQLIVYFVFLVIALSAAFLAGVMVGRNVDSSPEPMVRDIQDDRAAEETAASPTPAVLTYGSTLQSDKIEGLSPTPGAASTPQPAPRPADPVATPSPRPTAAAAATVRETPRSVPSPRATPKATATPAKPTPKPTVKPAPSPRNARASATPLNRLTIQVGAFKERSAAEAIVKRLKGKGYSAYLAPVSEGLFNVRVGSFENREDAERILAKLETQEKFKPFIVKP
jgi:cell division septation protein DedD